MKKIIIICILGLVLLAACIPQNQEESAVSPTVVIPTLEPTQTDTPQPPTVTLVPPTFTPTLTQTATITLTPTSMAQFDKIQILGGYYNGDNSIIYLVFPQVDKNYSIKMDQKNYRCDIDQDYADRVNCYGSFLDNQKAKSVLVQVFDPDSDDLIYENQVYVPMTIPTPLPVGAASTWCPLRGTNITCETEWRSESDGSTCVVKTCFDACGYYYSEHTCKEDPVGHVAIIEPTPTPH